MIVPRYYENLEMLHENTMSPRAYYIPASVRKDDLIENRENSDRFLLLNGEWNFKYFDSIYEVTDVFYEEGYDISEFDKIAVPECGRWQDTTVISIPISDIRFPLIHHTFHRIFRVERMCILSHIRKKKKLLRRF